MNEGASYNKENDWSAAPVRYQMHRTWPHSLTPSDLFQILFCEVYGDSNETYDLQQYIRPGKESPGRQVKPQEPPRKEEAEHDTSEPLIIFSHLAAAYLDARPEEVARPTLNQKTGEITYRRGATDFANVIAEEYGEHQREAAKMAYKTEKTRRTTEERKSLTEFFQRIKNMNDRELLDYLHNRLKAEVEALARGDNSHFRQTYTRRLQFVKKQIEWRGLKIDVKPTKKSAKAKAKKKASTPDVQQVSLF